MTDRSGGPFTIGGESNFVDIVVPPKSPADSGSNARRWDVCQPTPDIPHRKTRARSVSGSSAQG